MKSHQVAIDGRAFTIVSDDLYLDWVGDDFEPDMVRLFKRLVRPEHFVVDVGANIGMTSLLFGMLAKEVMSFEASPSTFQFLKMNVLESGLGNVHIENVGLGSAHAATTITMARNNRSGAFVSDGAAPLAGHASETIQITPLDHELLRRGRADQKVDFIKLDVEGFEMEVLKGATDCLARHQPVVALEMNHWCLNAFRRVCIPDFFDFLRATFPYVYAVDADSSVRNLRDEGQAYEVMYQHIVKFRFGNVVAGFTPNLPSLLLD